MGNNEIKRKRIPSVGELLHFWDDGKSSPSRHYICKVERIVPISQADSIQFDVTDYDTDKPTKRSLRDIWVSEKKSCDWLYAYKTDVFIEASCPKYDEHNLWFARTKDGGFFSMDIQNSWQSGRLDVDGEKFKEMVSFWEDENNYELVEAYKNCKY